MTRTGWDRMVTDLACFAKQRRGKMRPEEKAYREIFGQTVLEAAMKSQDIVERFIEIGRLHASLSPAERYWEARWRDEKAENERLRELKAPASKELLNITKAALDNAEAELERVRTRSNETWHSMREEIERLKEKKE